MRLVDRSCKATASSCDARHSPRKPSALQSSVGNAVEPGKVISKEERLQRRAARIDSVIGGLDGQVDNSLNYDLVHNWLSFRAKLAADPRWSCSVNEWDLDVEPNIGYDSSPFQDPGNERPPYLLRSLAFTIILFLLCFGALYTLLEYLLFFTRASACNATTVYVPVTYTITAGMSLVSALSSGNATSPTATFTSISTYTSTLVQTTTSYVTVSTGESATTSTAGPSYFYTTDSAGSTQWVNGISPSPGASVMTVTTTIVMRPLPPTDPAVVAQSTDTEIETVTPPAYTSTVYSFHDPDVTSTSTSTHYVTYTLEEVSKSRTITTTRSAHTGVSTSGWNASVANDPTGTALADPSTTTQTAIEYIGNGDDSTSTSTMFITTTIAMRYTTTIYPTAASDSGDPYVTTITALPVTITGGGSGPSLPTSTQSAVVSAGNTVWTNSSSSCTTSAGTGSIAHTMSNSSLTFDSSGIHPIPTPSTGSAPAGKSSVATGHFTAQSISHTVTAGAITGSVASSPVASNNGTAPASPAYITLTRSTPSVSGGLTWSANHTASATSPSGNMHQNGSMPTASNATVAGPATGTLSLATVPTTPPAYSTPAVPFSVTTPSISLANSFTSKTTRAKGSPVTFSPPASAPQSGMTTSVRSNASSVQSMTGSAIVSPASISPATTSTTRSLNMSSTMTGLPQSPSTTLQPSVISISNRSATTTSATNPFPATSATTIPTAGCGEQGDFLLTFDDLPYFLPSNANTTSISQAPPIFSPYHHLTFSDGYVYAPEPSEPYQPVSPPHVAVFLPNSTSKVASPNGNLVQPGEIGDGPRDSISAFWFDAQSAWFGCDNTGPAWCTLVFQAFTWNPSSNAEVLSYRQDASVPPCTDPAAENCQLQQVTFLPKFQNLTGLQIQAYNARGPTTFYMDNLALRWSNSSCAAGMLRQSSQ